MMAALDYNDFTHIFVTRELPQLERVVFRAVETLVADGTPEQASRIEAAYAQFLIKLESIAADIADEAHQAIVRNEEVSRVRPDTNGGGGDRLEDHIGFSHPLPAVPGSVGINYEPELDDIGMYWWRTNEDGYDWSTWNQDGSLVRGFFMPGFSRPSGGDYRTHPLFQATGKGPEFRPKNPIPARKFVLRGKQDVSPRWHAAIRQARETLIKEVDAQLLAGEKVLTRRLADRARRRRP